MFVGKLEQATNRFFESVGAFQGQEIRKVLDCLLKLLCEVNQLRLYV